MYVKIREARISSSDIVHEQVFSNINVCNEEFLLKKNETPCISSHMCVASEDR